MVFRQSSTPLRGGVDKDEKEDKKQPQVASSSLDQATNKWLSNKQTNKHVMIEIRISPLLMEKYITYIQFLVPKF